MLLASEICEILASAPLLARAGMPESFSLSVTAFTNYLQNCVDPKQPVTSLVLDGFLRRCLLFPFWREHKSELAAAMEKLLEHLNNLHIHHQRLHNGASERRGLLDIETCLQALKTQEFEIQQLTDLKAVLTRYLEKQMKSGDKLRLLAQPGQRILAIILSADGEDLKLRIFTNWTTLREGELVPLAADLQLSYNGHLELASETFHHLDIAPNITCRFKISATGITGAFLRGYTFQPFQTINGGVIASHPSLFYPIKRLEQFFINRKTDPLYMELTSLLEQSASLLRAGHPDARKLAHTTLKRAQGAFEHIFSEDKLMGLLIRDLTRAVELGEHYESGPLDSLK